MEIFMFIAGFVTCVAIIVIIHLYERYKEHVLQQPAVVLTMIDDGRLRELLNGDVDDVEERLRSVHELNVHIHLGGKNGSAVMRFLRNFMLLHNACDALDILLELDASWCNSLMVLWMEHCDDPEACLDAALVGNTECSVAATKRVLDLDDIPTDFAQLLRADLETSDQWTPLLIALIREGRIEEVIDTAKVFREVCPRPDERVLTALKEWLALEIQRGDAKEACEQYKEFLVLNDLFEELFVLLCEYRHHDKQSAKLTLDYLVFHNVISWKTGEEVVSHELSNTEDLFENLDKLHVVRRESVTA